MTHRKHSFYNQLGLGLLCSSALLISACGGGADAPSRSTSPTPPPSSTPAPTPTPTPGSSAQSKVQGPLDPVQDEVVTGVIADSVASQLPDPFDSTVVCISNAINSLVDIPDAALVLAQAGPSPDTDVTFNQMTTSLDDFVTQMQNLAYSLNGDGACDEDHPETPTNPFDPVVDQFAGTPLEPVVDALVAMAAVLETQGASEDPDLTALTSAVAPVLNQLFTAFAMVPAEVYETPVVGPALVTLNQSVLDVAQMLPAVGNFDAVGTQAGVETVVTNLLNGVLLGVVPASDIDDATGEDVSGEIATNIATLTATFGDTLSTVISPVFASGLTGAIAPVVNPVNGLVAAISGGGLPSATALDGALEAIAGNGSADPADLLASLLLTGDANLPVEALVAALTGNTDASPLEQLELLGSAGLPVESLLTSIVNYSAIGFSTEESIISSIDDLLGGLLDDLLGGLLGGGLI